MSIADGFLKDTYTMMMAMERIKQPSSFLVDTFFPVVPATAATTKIGVEYRKGARKLAPFIISGTGGVNVAREQSQIDWYEPPMMGPRRVISSDDIANRSFGENVYSSMTPEQRATQLLAKDLTDLQNMIVNRKNKMAADILLNGQCEIAGYAADGKVVKTDTVRFDDWTQKLIPAIKWNQANADIYGDLAEMSASIQENAGMVPTIAICGKNIMDYILGNEAMMKYMSISNNANLSMVSFQPRITAPQVMFMGRIMSLNLELYSYMETYTDEEGHIKSFIGDDDVIIGIPGRGKQLHGAVTLVEGRSFKTYVGNYVPAYRANENDNTVSLAMYSRCVLVPETVDDWAVIKAK